MIIWNSSDPLSSPAMAASPDKNPENNVERNINNLSFQETTNHNRYVV
jgi:hypothetical protein